MQRRGLSQARRSMSRVGRMRLLPTLAALGLLAGCAASDPSGASERISGAPQLRSAGQAPAEAPAAAMDEAADAAFTESDVMALAPGSEPAPETGDGSGEAASKAAEQGPAIDPVPIADPSRRIIKDGTLTIRVESVELGIGRIESIAVQVGGYVLETSTDYARRDGRRATIRLAVPVEAFEDAMRRIREVADEVEQEQASGTDVTQEYIDLQGQIANLEATQARVREFLDRAQSVEEALNVNARLTEIEGEIAQRRGRLRYLAQRSALSTIAVRLHEPAPEIPPDPTPTPEPLPDWSPRQTATEAYTALRLSSRGLVELAIWLGIAVLPLALPALALLWLLRRLWAGRRRGD